MFSTRCNFIMAFLILFGGFTMGGCAGRIRIKSIPPGAEIYKGNKKIGETPYSTIAAFTPNEDQKLLFVKKQGYYPEPVTINKPFLGKTSFSQEFTVELEKNHKFLTIISQPSGATVSLNGEKIGTTQLSYTLTFPDRYQSYSLLLSKDGYFDNNITVSLRPHDETEYHVELEKNHKTVQITSNPSGAAISLDNTNVGFTPWTKKLNFSSVEDQYVVILQHEGYYDNSTTITLRPHEKTSYHVILQKIEFISLDLKKIEPGPKGFIVRTENTLSYQDTRDERSPYDSSVTQVTDNRDKNFQIGPPVLSPVDEDLLVYDALTGEGGSQTSNIFREIVRTPGRTSVTKGTRISMSPAFTPDGKHIVFSSNRISNTLDLWRVQSDGRGGITSIDSSLSQDTFPAATRDLIFFASILPEATDYEIWSITIEGTLRTQIREGHSPQVSPDGKKVLFVRKNPLHGTEQIWLMDIDGRNETQLTQNQKYDIRNPKWSPDGKWIAYASSQGLDANGNRNFDIWVMKSDGTDKTQLTTNGSHDDAPCWDYKGEYIYFRSNRGFKWNIWRLTPLLH